MTDAIRTHIVKLLDSEEAHVDFDKAVADLPAELRGRRVKGFAHSPWELVEHLRLAQRDLLDFCRDPNYTAPKWPDDYWPARPEPPDAVAWDRSLVAFRNDREALKAFTADPGLDLTAKIPHGSGQTYLRSILLVADHNAYHLGQLVAVRQQLGAWHGSR
jgi:uncharacterized damage-inducible protein DinB